MRITIPTCTSLTVLTFLVAACGSESPSDSRQAPTGATESSDGPGGPAPGTTSETQGPTGASSSSSAVSPATTTGATAATASDPAPAPTSANTETEDPAPAPTTAGPTSSTTSSETPAPSPAEGGCAMGAWPAADPAAPGPYATVMETDVGPLAGEGEDGEPVPFTVFRPEELGTEGLCHPVVTWGNGTGSNPSLYRVLLGHLASHGFIVVASNSPNVAQGNPPPMVVGVSWLAEQNADPSSIYYQKVDTSHAGGTGHSQGGFATTTAGGDEQITTIAPLCGASPQRNLHGPALLLCGGLDDVVTCDSIQRSFDAITNQPVMLANYLEADHANWVTFRGTTVSPMETATTAWMRLHLMGDEALRDWFYGPSCKLCTDTAWEISQKMMD